MAKNWWDEGIPEERVEGSSGGNGGGKTGYTWWQRELPPRIFIKSGEKREITFVDEKCFRVWEHQFWIDGRPGWATCTKKIRGHCALCDAGSPAYEAGFFTVIDHTGYKDREGIEHKDYLSLLPAKHFTMDLLREKHALDGGLKSKRYLVCRTRNQKAPTVGDDWNFMREETLPAEAEALDYPEILKPFEDDDMREIQNLGEWRGKKIAITTGAGYKEDADYEDEDSGTVPF